MLMTSSIPEAKSRMQIINNIKFAFTLLIIFSGNFVFSQNSVKIDSLENLLTKTADDTSKLKILFNLSAQYKNNCGKIILYSEKAVKLAESMPEKKFAVSAWKNIAAAYFRYEKYTQALEYQIKIQKYNETAQNQTGIANSDMEIGKIYFSMGNFNKALELYNQALHYFLKGNGKSATAACLTNIGIVFHTIDNTDSAIVYYLKAINIYEDIGDKNNVANLLIGIGDIETSHNNYSNVEKYYARAFQNFKDIDDKNGCAKVLSALGDFNIKRGDTELAIKKYKEALDIGKADGSLSVMKVSLEGLSDAYEKAGNYKLAFESVKTLASIKDSILNKENLKQLNDVQGKFESEKKQKEIELLKEKDVNNKITIYSFLTGLLLIAFLSLVIFNRYNIKQKSAKIIHEKNKELELLSIVASETENVILIMDANGKLEWVNDSFVRLNAISLNELIKLKGETIFEISNNTNIRNIIEKSVREKRPVVYESLNMTTDGKKVWESSTLTPIFDQEGKLKKLIIIDTDITVRKVSEDIIKEKQKEILDSIHYAKRIQTALLTSEKYIERNLNKLHHRPKL
jgi:PAS domain S-box-containing protein